MSHECCSFCEELPGIPKAGWAGQASKCPVCKQALWTANGGATYRLDASLPMPPARRWPWVAGAAMLVGIGAIVLAFSAGGRREAPALSLRAEARPLLPSVIDVTEPVHEPQACAKPGQGENPSRAKPAAPPAKPRPVEPARDVAANVAPAPTVPAAAPPLSWNLDRAEHLSVQLLGVPQVDLEPEYMKKSKAQLAQLGKDIVKENADTKDAFIAKLMKDRADLAGMPFVMGKDCTLADKDAKTLARDSLQVRTRIGDALRETLRKSYGNMTGDVDMAAFIFWSRLHTSPKKDGLDQAEAIPALKQILLAEHTDYRSRLLEHVKPLKSPNATELLANRALFDLDPEVRQLAVTLLKDRPKEEYRAALLKGLRYPWQPVVRSAAHAIATLELKEAVPELVAILDEPDPTTPFVKMDNGKEKHFVRELVRINHHRNCLLCHAPVNTASKDEMRLVQASQLPVGPAVSGADPLPPSISPVYYSERSGSLLVRADVTYLRQDFSLQQPVENHGKWPLMQRFDFLVRTRELSAAELATRPPMPLSVDNQVAVLAALRTLTGKNAPPQAQAWREVLGLPAEKAQLKQMDAK